MAIETYNNLLFSYFFPLFSTEMEYLRYQRYTNIAKSYKKRKKIFKKKLTFVFLHTNCIYLKVIFFSLIRRDEN